MSTLQLVTNLRKLSRIQPILWHSVRFFKRRRGGPLPNTLDPDKDFYMDDDFENEPVAYLDKDPNAKQKPKKLTPRDEREQQKELLRKQILKKKGIKANLPKDPSLLTWAARAQIKHLHSIDPEQWDLDALARSFPVSKYAIKEVLRSKQIPYDRQHITKHDRIVHKNWIKLKEQAQAHIEGKPVDPEFRLLLEDERRRSCLVNAAGIPDFPIPQEQNIVQTMQDIAEEARPVVKREFSFILDKCQSAQDSLNTDKKDPGYIGFNNQEIQALLENIAKPNSEDVMSSDEADVEHIDDTDQQLTLRGDRGMSDYDSDDSTVNTYTSRHSRHNNYRRNVKYGEMEQLQEETSDLRQNNSRDRRQRDNSQRDNSHNSQRDNRPRDNRQRDNRQRDNRQGYYSDESTEETYSRSRSYKPDNYRSKGEYSQMNQGQSEEGMHDFRQHKRNDHRQRDHRTQFDIRNNIHDEGRGQKGSKKQWKDNKDYGNTRDRFLSENRDNSHADKRSHREHQGQNFPSNQSAGKREQPFNRNRDRYEDQFQGQNFQKNQSAGKREESFNRNRDRYEDQYYKDSYQDRRPNRITGSLEDIYLLNRPNDGNRSNKKWSRGSKGRNRDHD